MKDEGKEKTRGVAVLGVLRPNVSKLTGEK